MREFRKLLRRFGADERGVFAVIFAILAIVLVATAGAVVDFTTVQQARARAQDALDSAALGLQPRIFEDPAPTTAALQAQAQALLVERLADANVTATVENVTTNVPDGRLRLEARITVPMSFVTLVGVENMSASVVSEATRKQLNLEVVMVLDNSRSMLDSNRMTHLIAATKCAANILLNNNCGSTETTASNDKTWIGIVPFTMQVKVGTEYANATWMDRTGNVTGSHSTRPVNTFSRNITNDNFDNDDTYSSSSVFNGPVDRIALFNQISNVSWGGCVEGRKPPYDTQDDPPVAGTDTMFTPLFAPDEPDTGGFSNNYLSDSPAICNYAGTCTWTHSKNRCSSWTSCASTSVTTNTYTPSGSRLPTGQTCTCSSTGPWLTDTGTPSSSCVTGGGGTSPNNKTCTRVRTCAFTYTPALSQREFQERICKYNGSTASGVSQAAAKGPNADCPVNAVTPLTSDKATVTAAINALAPQGGTNIHAGTIWGWHLISPTEPFTQGLPYNAANSKVMIIMTDGENTAYKANNINGTTFYSFYGFPFNQRMGNTSWTDAQLESEMDARTVTTCNNAKAMGIKIYTIGLATATTSNQTKVETMLRNCSTGPGYYFFPADPAELTSVFKTIANQLSVLRLAK